ncbi:MAG: PAS domain-containing sensor histidine kinase, partial [Chitinophagaceae bacterium]
NRPVSYEADFLPGLHPDDKERIVSVIDRLFDPATSNGEYDVEYRTIGAGDGRLRWVRAKGKVYFHGEKPVRFIGSVLDITAKMMAIQRTEALVEERTRELALANQTLQSTNKELQRSNQNLEEFAHAASHDLKEPVRKIHFFTSLLRSQLTSHLKQDELRSFERIENATQRMRLLIDDLLLYSHASQRPIEMEEIDLNKKFANVLEDLELEIEQKHARIEVGTLPTVRGYKRQLQQMFQNLVSNALKYSKADEPPHIRIASKAVQADGKQYFQITVADNGIGFEQAYAGKVFQMFARLHNKSEYSGTGVGLSIVKKVVENHGGQISVQSEPGVGSVFTVLLPV